LLQEQCIVAELPKVVIIGSSSLGESVASILQEQGEYQIIGTLDDDLKASLDHRGINSLGCVNDYCRLALKHPDLKAIIAIGNPKTRAVIFSNLTQSVSELCLISAVHPASSLLSTSDVGPGCIIFPGVVISSGVRLGRCCLLNSNVTIGSRVLVGDFTSISPGVNVGSEASIGRETFIGMGAVISQKIAIGNGCAVGALSFVNADVPDACKAIGIPAQNVNV
jgi:sugar O-acyltransferase (sialic acid O-acetyltransferase NeuD family)